MLRHFSFQPIHGRDRKILAYQALLHTGYADLFYGNRDAASLVMVDNWLLYDFEKLTGGLPAFLECTRETLMSGFTSLLPRSAVIMIHESVQPDRAVVAACRKLKELGYRIALGNVLDTNAVRPLLEMADYIQLDFQVFSGQERSMRCAFMQNTGAQRIAMRVETPEQVTAAFDEGFDLVQGSCLGGFLAFAKDRDRVHPLRCLGILDKLAGAASSIDEFAYWVGQDTSLEARIKHAAGWIAGGAGGHSTHGALELIGRSGLRKVLKLAMCATLEHRLQVEPILAESA